MAMDFGLVSVWLRLIAVWVWSWRYTALTPLYRFDTAIHTAIDVEVDRFVSTWSLTAS